MGAMALSMRHSVCRLFVFLIVVCCWSAAPAWGQPSGTFIPDKVKWKTKKKDGWFPDLDASFNFSFAQSDGVVGVPDGTTINFGVQLVGGLVYSHKAHEWRSQLQLIHAQTKLPNINTFLKSADKLDFETGYTFRFTKSKWIGIFASLELETPLLPGFLVRDANTRLSITEVDGTKQERELVAQNAFKLTESFAPLLFKQSVGLSMTPYDQPFFRINFKVGGGAVQAFLRDGLRIVDDAATADLFELSRMQNYVQIGAEAKLVAGGTLFSKILNYKLLGSIMLPFYTSINTNKPYDQLLNFSVAFKLGIKVFSWLSINYSLSANYVPLIQPDVQLVNNLVLSLTWSVI